MRFKVIYNEKPVDEQPPRWLARLGKLLAALLILFIALNVVVKWVADYIWMDTLGYGRVFLTIFTTKIGLSAIGFALFFFGMFTLLWNIRKTYLREFPDTPFVSFIRERKPFIRLNGLIAVLAGLLGSFFVQGLGWEPFLAYLNQVSFDLKDPYFGRDIAFFVFTLPLWNFALGVLTFLTGAGIFIKLFVYSLRGLIVHSRQAQRHFLASIVAFGILLAARFALVPYERALTKSVNMFQNSAVFGISFTDHFVNIPFDYVMAGVTLIATLLLVVAIVRRRFRFAATGAALFFGVLVLGKIVSIAVQSLIVSPNEFARETPYLKHNMEYTREAYGLNDVKIKNKEIKPSLTSEMLGRNDATVQNIRVNDARPLNDVYNQLQTFRPYYHFFDVDVDRYRIDGKDQQVFIAVRELTQENLPEQAQTWVNKMLRYTHGYGVSVSNVNEITAEGQPGYLVKDLPPEGPIEVKRPQIYFGENDYRSVIVGSKVDEFDYPSGDKNVYHRYEGKHGIPMTGWNRLIFAWNEKSFRYLVSQQVTEDSQLLQTRNIKDRVKRIAPFLTLDDDPYPVVRDDGTIIWLLDAYTETDRFPFSDRGGTPYNYVKNPIKITVDAYTGEVTFYLIDPEEPLAKTYQNMFPTLFETDVPDDIRNHFRYPIDLFKIQANMYRAYHMTNLELFYNREDYWQIPTEKYGNEDVTMEPYYVTMKLEDAPREEFILMLPFTPNTKQNMIAWMAVRNDSDAYGEMLVYEFSKQRNIYGPQQIENRINQNATISQQLNLWSQGGSRVIRGNLLVIPVEDTVLYVEPLYIESNNETALPEVKQIVVAYQDHIVMEATLEQALERLMERIGESAPTDKEKIADLEETSPRTADDMLTAIQQTFETYQKANHKGDYEAAGRALKQLEQLLGEWKKGNKGK